MFNDCDSCDSGYIHEIDCTSNDTLDIKDCDCLLIKCPDCRGRGKIHKPSRNEVNLSKGKKKLIEEDY